MPNYGHLSLSCAKIERPSPPEKSPCKVRLFVQNRSRKYRQKVTVTTLFQTAFHRIFQLLPQTAHACFCGRKWVHTRLSEKNRTQGHTRRNRWCFGWGVVSLPSERSARFGNPAWPGGRTANFAAFGPWSGVLSKNTESLRNSDALMRVAVPRRRGPAGLRNPVAIVSMIKNMINPWAGSFLIFCWANANSIKKVVLQPF